MASPDLSDPRGTVAAVTERLCKDCDGLLSLAPRDDEALTDEAWELDLMCVLCGAAMTRGGPLYGELAAIEEHDAA